ncbi:hypothetical protein Tsp_09837 [Trichinella spiralis]|uniref:hypothetical protein n=1 Tax=Trichinella spiralis TaxID=6334 RepID=UPI0001EFDA04|nr:hypothetical protein Tsp_09837 [Trichinella spiralis]
MLIPLQIGQNCTLRVPDVDRGPADPKNFLVVAMAECEGLYTVGCREGKLASKFTAADLQLRAAKDMLSACAYPAAHLVDAVAAEKEYYAILDVTPGSHAKIYKPRAIHLFLIAKRLPIINNRQYSTLGVTVNDLLKLTCSGDGQNLKFYTMLTHTESADDPPVYRDSHFEKHCFRISPPFQPFTHIFRFHRPALIRKVHLTATITGQDTTQIYWTL